MIIKPLISLLALVSLLAVASHAANIEFLQLIRARLISTSEQHYAITSPLFAGKKWRSVTRNDEIFVIVENLCETRIVNINSLTEEERGLIDEARSQFPALDRIDTTNQRGGRFVGSESELYPSIQGQIPMRTRWVAVDRFDEHDFSVFMSTYPSGLERVFISDDLITFVYADGHLLMKPIGCLNDIEKTFHEQFSQMVVAVEEKFASLLPQIQPLDVFIRERKEQISRSLDTLDRLYREPERRGDQIALVSAQIDELTKTSDTEQFRLLSLRGNLGNIMKGFSNRFGQALVKLD